MGGCILVAVLILASTSGFVQGANILFYFGVSTYSHRVLVWPLVEELSARGHNLTFLSPYPNKDSNPNLRVIDLVPDELQEFFGSVFDEESNRIQDRFSGNRNAIWELLPTLGVKSCELFLQSPKWQKWVSESQFDLVVVDALYSECGHGLAFKFKARVMVFKAKSIFPWDYDMMGLPSESSWIPDISKDYPEDMDFLTRVMNTVSPILNYGYHRLIYQPQLNEILRKGLDIPDMPSLHQLHGNISVILLNTHYSTDYARSLPPMYVHIARMVTQVTKLKPLSQEMSKFIDTAPDGFLYVSFGSAVQVSKMEPSFQQIFFNAFGNSTMKFIWKYEGKLIPKEMPSNVFTANWIPQQAVLAHSKCRGFITHGGLGSIHEAMEYGVPLIVMPIFMDNGGNAERVKRLGLGISLEITTISQSELEDAIRKITTDPSYRTRMEEISISFKDRQNNPLQTAVWWTEKVLRSSDFELSLIRPGGRNQAWWIRRHLDVWFLIFHITDLIFILVTIILLKITWRIARNSGKLFSGRNKIKSS